MKLTGKFNPFTEEEIMEVELSDVLKFIDTDWDNLSIDQLTTFMSFRNYEFLNDVMRDVIRRDYIRYQVKYGSK